MKRFQLLIQLLIVGFMVVFTTIPSYAVNPDEVLSDPELEGRARNLSSGLRCLVCQNESIDGSNADLARDLRILVRERLVAGDTDQEVLDFVVSRYGDFVLLKPRFTARTLMLWSTPVLLLIIGAVALLVFYRKRQHTASPEEPLNEAEQKRLKEIIKES